MTVVGCISYDIRGPLGRGVGKGGMPSDVRFAEVRRLVEARGWVLVRVRGSHDVFRLPDGRVYVVPVHRGKVKYAYVREIKKLLEEG